jgi:hypothetical protein
VNSRWLALTLVLAATLAACFRGERTEPGTATRNGGTTSLFVARERAGGKAEGPLGFAAPLSRSRLYDDLAAMGIRAETLGPLNEIKDPRIVVAVMKTFTQALGVRCSWCHDTNDFGAPTPRKAVTAFMWDAFVAQLQLVDGGPVYCDSCHHQSTIFLHRNVSEKTWLAKYMQTEYVDQLRRRDGKAHGCGTCHSKPFNPRFLPRLSDPPGYRAPVAEPGPQP